MTIRSSQPSWPMDATTLPQPRIGVTLGGTAVLSIVFCGATALLVWHMQKIGGLSRAWADEPPVLICVGAFSLGTALALSAFGWVLLSVLRNGPVWHAAAAVLPDVPSEPVSAGEQFFALSGGATYVLRLTENGWRFGPKTEPLRGVRWFGIPWMTLVAAGIVIIIWCFQDAAFLFKCLYTVGVAAAWGAMCAILWFLPKMIKPLPFAMIDQQRGLCEVGPEPVISVPLDHIVAVQLCAHRWKSQESFADGVEANLVWLPTDSEPPAERHCQRAPLMFFTSDVCRKARLAGQLAEKLGVPLLCHASREHWRVERERAKHRPPVRSIPPCFPGVRATAPAEAVKPNA